MYIFSCQVCCLHVWFFILQLLLILIWCGVLSERFPQPCKVVYHSLITGNKQVWSLYWQCNMIWLMLSVYLSVMTVSFYDVIKFSWLGWKCRRKCIVVVLSIASVKYNNLWQMVYFLGNMSQWWYMVDVVMVMGVYSMGYGCVLCTTLL